MIPFISWLIICSPTFTPDPGLPTIPPQRAPVQVTMDDGSRLDCTPNYAQCWSSHLLATANRALANHEKAGKDRQKAIEEFKAKHRLRHIQTWTASQRSGTSCKT